MARVLVVDDNGLTLQFLRSALETLGHRCSAAASGEQALACVDTHDRFDLLLIDARMPHCSGAQTLALIRNGSSPSRATPAVATTAADASSNAPLLQQGFAEVIGKPIGLDALAHVIGRHVVRDASIGACGDELPGPLLDDRVALGCAGDDQGIVDALRGLFAAELDALPRECAELCADNDADGLRERLHRLAASAGFCGAMALANAIARAEAALATPGVAADCPELATSLQVAASTRAALGMP